MNIMSYNQDFIYESEEDEVYFWWGGPERLVVVMKTKQFLEGRRDRTLFCMDPTRPEIYDGGKYKILKVNHSKTGFSWETI